MVFALHSITFVLQALFHLILSEGCCNKTPLLKMSGAARKPSVVALMAKMATHKLPKGGATRTERFEIQKHIYSDFKEKLLLPRDQLSLMFAWDVDMAGWYDKSYALLLSAYEQRQKVKQALERAKTEALESAKAEKEDEEKETVLAAAGPKDNHADGQEEDEDIDMAGTAAADSGVAPPAKKPKLEPM